MHKVISILLVSLLFFISGCSSDTSQESIIIRGSDSEVNLVTALAEEYMKINPDVAIAVTGGGSGVGIAALIDDDIDVANSSRPMSKEEVVAAETQNNKKVYSLRFATDGVATIVNQNNPINELTIEEIGAIYRGEITNWQEVGGNDIPITLYGRQSTSGTYSFFMSLVVQGEYSDNKRNLGGNSEIVESVLNDETGIGYVAIGYIATIDDIKALKIAKDANSNSYSPLELENITSGNYPLTRPLYQYILGNENDVILDFFKFEVSDAGQKIVLQQGFYPITAVDIDYNQEIFK